MANSTSHIQFLWRIPLSGQSLSIPLQTMSQYQLTCDCGAIVPVSVSQAGANVPCPQCSKAIQIPGTRQLRALPPVAVDPASAIRRRDGQSTGLAGFVGRAIAAGLLALATWGLGYGGYLAYLRWTAPIEFGHSEDEFYSGLYDQSLQDPPARAWDHWQYIVETGLPDHNPPIYFVLVDMFEKQRPWMIGALVVGALSLIAFISLSVLQFRRGQAR